jgi:hypothetical protein
MNDHSDLKEKIGEAKRRLPLPELMTREGLSQHAKKEAHCCFHDDEHKSFSVFKGRDGFWHWRCFAGCGDGDEIMFLRKLRGLSQSGAMSLYLEMAGYPGHRPESREYPKPLSLPGSLSLSESPCVSCVSEFPVVPVSNGQGSDKEKALKAFAARNACTERSTARKRRWQLARDLRALEKGIGRDLIIGELMVVFDEWHRLSQPFLDPAKTRDAYLAAFLAELRKVRVPTGEGDTINKALEAVAKLSLPELPVIPGMPDAPESWRRLAAIHRELSHRTGGKTYFLTCRDAAKASPSMCHQNAYNINLALARLGVIKIVRVGDAHPNGGKASEFRYLLSQSENGGEEEDDAGFEL